MNVKEIILFAGSILLLFGTPLTLLYAFTLIDNIPLDKEIDPTYINGFITASGVLLAFVMTTIISKSEELGFREIFILSSPLFFFSFTMFHVYMSEIEGTVRVEDLLWVLASLFVNLYSVLLIFQILHKRQTRTT